ncbi:MAG: amino acid dehydrogenase [Rickettsiales bacterium]|nr:amino acid dehydrogenase [Rickettsiales bacterium]
MKITILGAGSLGVMSAYYLSRSGHEVTVLDRQPEAARECSFANGGQLSYSHAEPWANPYVFPKVLKWMWQDDAPLVLRFSLDPHMISWGLRFLWNCRKSAADVNSRRLLRLGLHSKAKMHEVMEDTGVPFHHQDKGILHVFSEEKEFEHACHQADYQKTLGCEEKVLSWDECLELEPALKRSTKKIYGGIHAPIDESGDIRVFTQGLAAYLAEKQNVEFRHNVHIHSLEHDGERITKVATDQGDITSDAFVMSLGAYSPLYLRPLGINVPIYPMKGYSVTFPVNDDMPYVSVTDDALKIVFSRLGDQVRVAGTAEFAGYDSEINQKRIEPILKGIRTLFPTAEIDNPSLWACLRPSTPDGPPIIGKTKLKNLYLNTGHGTLGWTQAAGSANLLASVINDTTPEIDMNGMTAARFT